MSKDIDSKIDLLLKKLSEEIKSNLLISLSVERTEWLMNDINHLIFSHLLNDLVALHDDE